MGCRGLQEWERPGEKEVDELWQVVQGAKKYSDGLVGKESTCNTGDTGDEVSIHGSGRSLGGGNGSPLQYSYLENPLDRRAYQATVHGVARIKHN